MPLRQRWAPDVAVTPLQNFRADADLWEGAQAALDAVEGPRRVMVTVTPGMTRSAAIVAFLRALTRPAASPGRGAAGS